MALRPTSNRREPIQTLAQRLQEDKPVQLQAQWPATNTRVNHLILEARERGLKVGILFCRYDTLEQLAIAELSPPWNIQ